MTKGTSCSPLVSSPSLDGMVRRLAKARKCCASNFIIVLFLSVLLGAVLTNVVASIKPRWSPGFPAPDAIVFHGGKRNI
jgi:hypothetical protein